MSHVRMSLALLGLLGLPSLAVGQGQTAQLVVGPHAAACALDGTRAPIVATTETPNLSRLRDEFTVDVWFQPCWDESELPESEQTDASRCLWSLRADDANVHHAVYLGADLDYVAFDNGKDQERFDHEFRKNTWYHLTVVVQGTRTVVAVDGEPIGVRDIGLGRTNESCTLRLGGTSASEDLFFGAVGPIRFFDTALSFAETSWLRERPGAPESAALSAHLVGWSEMTPEKRSLRAPAKATAEARAEAGTRERLAAPFAKAVTWQRDVASAQKLAKGTDKLIAAYTTSALRSPSADAMEAGPLNSDWWKQAAAESCVPLLLVAQSTPDAKAPPVGSIALLDADGAVIRVCRPFDEDQWDFELGAARLYSTSWQKGSSLEDRAGALLFEASCCATDGKKMSTDLRARLERLIGEVAAASTTDLARDRVALATSCSESCNLQDRIRQLQQRFAREQQKAVEAGNEVREGTKSFLEAVLEMQEAAYAIWTDATLPIPPNPEFARFAALLFGHVTRVEVDADEDLLEAVANFARPIGDSVPFASWEVRSSVPFGQ